MCDIWLQTFTAGEATRQDSTSYAIWPAAQDLTFWAAEILDELSVDNVKFLIDYVHEQSAQG